LGRGVSELLAAIDTDTFDGLRFHTQVLLMLDTGVRAGEICVMDTTDVSPKADAIKVWGKGSKERMVYPTRDMSSGCGSGWHTGERRWRRPA
jgi:site-specific recombinase XerD